MYFVNLPSLIVPLQCHYVTLFPDKKTKVQRYQVTKVATAGDPVPLGTEAMPFTTQPPLGLAVPLGTERINQVHACLSVTVALTPNSCSLARRSGGSGTGCMTPRLAQNVAIYKALWHL